MSEREREIRDGIEQARLPSTIERPTVERISLDSFPVYTMAVFGDDLDVTERFVEEELTPRLATLAGIAEVAQNGGHAEVLPASVGPASLAAYALTHADTSESPRDRKTCVK